MAITLAKISYRFDAPAVKKIRDWRDKNNGYRQQIRELNGLQSMGDPKSSGGKFTQRFWDLAKPLREQQARTPGRLG